MAGSLDETLGLVGYAQVVVTLTDTAAVGVRDVRDLESAFISPRFAGFEALDTAAGIRAMTEAGDSSPARALRMRVYPRLGMATGYVDRRGASVLRASRRVDRVDEAPVISLIRPVLRREIYDAPDQGLAAAVPTTWGLDRLRVPEVWDAGFTGGGVTVAHLDTGVDASHPAFQGANIAFAEFDLAGDLIPGAQAHDSDEHGTHTAGTIIGRQTDRGRFGVAPDASLASALVIEGGNVVDRILGGLEWSLSQGASVLSMSLGLRGFTPAFQNIIDALLAANVLPVIAVGNEHKNTSRSPGNYANVLSVGAIDIDDTVAAFSSSQWFNRVDDPQTPDLVAPGVDVLSSIPGGGYAEMSGSSMATPHVAGLAALLSSANPGATPSDLQSALFMSCERPASMPQDRANRGVPDGMEALRIIRS